MHDYLFKVIKTIPSDCSFDQLSGRSLSQVKGVKVSADLTAATDRFPIQVQKNLLTALTNETFSDAWVHTMVGYPFKLKQHVVTYSSGQPMGAHSS